MQQNPLSAVMPKAGFICIIIREIPCFFGADIDQRQVFAYRFGKTPQRSIESHTIFFFKSIEPFTALGCL